MRERRFIWLRRSLLTSLCLLAAAWIFAESSQWLFRRRAERLLTDLKSIEVGGNSADAQAILQKWHDRAEIERDCFGTERTTCHFGVYLRHQLPQVLRGDPEGEIRNRFQQIVGALGLRSSNVGTRVRTENGIVTRKWFAEEVDLPIRDWYLRGGAYVPTLTVDSDEELPSQHPAKRPNQHRRFSSISLCTEIQGAMGSPSCIHNRGIIVREGRVDGFSPLMHHAVLSVSE